MQKTFNITLEEWNKNKVKAVCKTNFGKDVLYFLYTITHKKSGFVYSGSKTAYTLEGKKNSANHYYGHSKGTITNDICTEQKIKENGISEYNFEVVQFCKSADELRRLEIDLNTLNKKLNGNRCVNGYTKGFESHAGISIGPHSQQHCQNISKGLKGKKKSQEHCDNLKISKQNKILINNGSKAIKIHKNDLDKYLLNGWVKGALRNRGNEAKFKCPYDNHITSSQSMGTYIFNRWPELKQWMQYTYEERQNFRIK